MSVFNKLFQKQQKESSSIQENQHTELPEEKAANDTVENKEGISLLDLHEKELLDDISFLSSFGKVKIFYSTPFGDHKDGGSRVFALPAQDETAYLPVFTSAERAVEFYEKAGRCGFLIMEGSFTSFLETTKQINEKGAPIKMGAVIDPGYYGVTVHANALDMVIDITK